MNDRQKEIQTVPCEVLKSDEPVFVPVVCKCTFEPEFFVRLIFFSMDVTKRGPPPSPCHKVSHFFNPPPPPK